MFKIEKKYFNLILYFAIFVSLFFHPIGISILLSITSRKYIIFLTNTIIISIIYAIIHAYSITDNLRYLGIEYTTDMFIWNITTRASAVILVSHISYLILFLKRKFFNNNSPKKEKDENNNT